MLQAPRISVLMAVYNGQPYVRQAVESLLAQTFRDFEMVIVDDASTDATPGLLESLARQDVRIVRLRNDRNLGLAGSLNKGLAVCRAPLVARADADDVYLPDRLEKQVRFMETHPDVGVLGTAVEFVDGQGQPCNDRLQHFHTRPAPLRFFTHLGCCLWHTVVVFRTELVRSVGGYDEQFARGPEDYDLWARLMDHTSFGNLPDVLARVRLHGESTTSTWDSGFKQYCSVSQRLLSRYLGRSLSESESGDVVTLFGWTCVESRESIWNGVRLLREIRTSAQAREDRDTLIQFRDQCVRAFLTEAAIMVYGDPAVSRGLFREALAWSPTALFTCRALRVGIRLIIPTSVREALKQVRKSVAGDDSRLKPPAR